MFSEYMIIALFYILGIVFSRHIDMSGAVSIFLAIFFVGIIRILRKKSKSLSILILSLVFLFGASRYFQSTQKLLYILNHQFLLEQKLLPRDFSPKLRE